MRKLQLVMAGMLAGGVAVATLVAVPAAIAGAAPGANQGNSKGDTSVNACPAVVAPGQATCLARKRTDPKATAQRPAKPGHATSTATLGNGGAYDPSYLQSAYVTPSAGSGTGQTVAIVDAYNDPSAQADLGQYRSFFGLSACTTSNGCFRQVNEHGGTTLPTGNKGWGQEISLDLDMVSAVCPNCHILLVSASSTSIADLGTSVNEAVSLGANVVSNSYGGPEYSAETKDNASFYSHPGVAVTVAAGDAGYGTEFPAASNTVTAVGGTSLQQATNTGTRNATETVWSGSGSGCSAYEPKPAWQTDTGCAKRTVADVSAVADPNTGVWVYDTYGGGTWSIFGGTSVATPIIGSLYALAANAPGSTAMNSLPYAHTGNLNDVTSGSNGTCSVAYLCTGETGYDGPTGLGTPNGIAAFAATPAVPTAPGAPTNLAASGSNGTAKLTWAAPLNSGGSPITGYNVFEGTSPGGESATPVNGATLVSGTSDSVSGLPTNTPLYFTVQAVNAIGSSASSNEATSTLTVATAPGAPTNLVATGTNAKVALTWAAPLSNGGSALTGYQIWRGTSPGSETLLTTLGVTTSASDTAVVNGTTYYYEILAVNAVSAGSPSGEALATPATIPGAAQGLTAVTATTKGVTLTWAAPVSNGGAAVTGYTVERGTKSNKLSAYTSVACTTSTCTFTDTGTNSRTAYFYEVAAVNHVGTGPVSNQASAQAK
jgi:subtilase family serine protease